MLGSRCGGCGGLRDATAARSRSPRAKPSAKAPGEAPARGGASESERRGAEAPRARGSGGGPPPPVPPSVARRNHPRFLHFRCIHEINIRSISSGIGRIGALALGVELRSFGERSSCEPRLTTPRPCLPRLQRVLILLLGLLRLPYKQSLPRCPRTPKHPRPRLLSFVIPSNSRKIRPFFGLEVLLSLPEGRCFPRKA